MASIYMNQCIDFNNPLTTKPANLANSAVLRMLEEEEQRQRSGQQGKYLGGRRENDRHGRRIDRLIEWPPKTSANNGNGLLNMNNTYSARFFAPVTSGLKRVAWPPPPEENGQPIEEAPVRQEAPVKVHQSPALSRLIPIEQEHAPLQTRVYSPLPVQSELGFQPVAPTTKPVSPQPAYHQKPLSPHPTFHQKSPLSPQQATTPTQVFPPPLPDFHFKPVPAPTSFCPINQEFLPSSQADYFQDLGPAAAPPPASASPRGWAPVSSPTPLLATTQYQFIEPPSGVVTLRPTAPVHLPPPPVVTSQPATNSYRGGINMRGDQKWPPQNVKEAVAAENEARILLAKGPACRPRKVRKDYNEFFAKNALPHNYPGYRAPPGTQHFDEPSRRNF